MSQHSQLHDDLRELTDDEDFVELVELVTNARRQPKKYINRIDHFVACDDKEFVQRFRLSKHGVRFVVNQIESQKSSPTDWNHAVTTEEMMLVTLRYFATGNFLQTLGDFVGIEKETAGRIIWKVTRAIAGLHRQYIRMPESQSELETISRKFYSVAQFPKCIGAIDCTHIKISAPGGNNEEIFRNRKGFFSLNVQAICDSNCMFQDVVCCWPGFNDNSQIFANSNISVRFEQGDFKEYLLVGDSSYALKNYLMTPLANPVTRQEKLFNESHIRSRNCIERKFEQWKRRFPILVLGIRLKVEEVEAVVVATAVLDNIAKLLNEPVPPSNEEEAQTS